MIAALARGGIRVFPHRLGVIPASRARKTRTVCVATGDLGRCPSLPWFPATQQVVPDDGGR
jgi:hypothetical protein